MAALPPWITAETCERLARPAGQAVGLPGAVYADEAFFAIDRDRVLARSWVCVALEADLPGAGDLFPVTLAGLELLLARGGDGKIRGFYNVCAHRGLSLVEAPKCAGKLIVCPYHGWSYDLGGRLVQTPHIGGPRVHEAAAFDASGVALSAIRVASWAGLVFVNLDGAAPPLEQHIAPLAARWAAYDLESLRHGGGLQFELKANWKLAIENFLERYHLPFVHPALNRYSNFSGTFLVFGEPLFVGSGSTTYTGPETAGAPLPRFAGEAGADLARAEYLSVFPNLLVGLHADHLYAFFMLPQAAGRTVERFEFFFVGEGADGADYAEARAALMERRQVTNLEDIGVVERLQRGSASPGFAGARFSPFFETTTLAFQRSWLAALLAEKH